MAYSSSYIEDLLNTKAAFFNNATFIPNDPICIPHRFSIKQDIEISGLFAAVLAWGQRKTIINKCSELLHLMDNAPYDFLVNHSDTDLAKFEYFVHRTFNSTDLLYFIEFLSRYYKSNDSLETLFAVSAKEDNVGSGLINFKKEFFSLDFAPKRTQKHISSPLSGSACKRINMYLRWMVRNDESGVDFGIWKNIRMDQLICPLDVHVERVARKLGLLTLPGTNWKSALELTKNLKKYNPSDPVKFDFALFSLGVEGEF